MGENVNVYYKNKNILIVDNDKRFEYEKYDIDGTTINDCLINKLSKHNIVNVVFDENIEIYNRLHFINILDTLGCKINIYNKYVSILYGFINKLWLSSKEEACYPGENIVCLFMDLMDRHLCISCIKIENTIEKLELSMLYQYKSIVEIEGYTIDDYLDKHKGSNTYDEAEHWIRLKTEEHLEKSYVGYENTFENYSMGHVILLEEFSKHLFIRKYFKNKFCLKSGELVSLEDEPGMLFDGVRILNDIKNKSISMPFSKEGFTYLKHNVYVYQYIKDEKLIERRQLLKIYDLLPKEVSQNIIIDNLSELPVSIEFKIVDKKGITRVEHLELDFPFIYNGDEIKIEVCAIKGHDIVLELRVEHLRSRYFINDKILIDN